MVLAHIIPLDIVFGLWILIISISSRTHMYKQIAANGNSRTASFTDIRSQQQKGGAISSGGGVKKSHILREDQEAGVRLVLLPDGHTTAWAFIPDSHQHRQQQESTSSRKDTTTGNQQQEQQQQQQQQQEQEGASSSKCTNTANSSSAKNNKGKTGNKGGEGGQCMGNGSGELPVIDEEGRTMTKEETDAEAWSFPEDIKEPITRDHSQQEADDEDNDDNDDEGEVPPSSSNGSSSNEGGAGGSKIKRKKKKRKGGSKKVAHRAASTGNIIKDASEKQRERSSSCPKGVRWGEIVVRTFKRTPSHDTVPASGAWPLGFGEEDSHHTILIDKYEDLKHEDIERRIMDLPKRLRKIATGETRQFDYKTHRERNPIFGPMEEKDRKLAILKALCELPNKHVSTRASIIKQEQFSVEESEKLRCVELDDLRASRKRVGCSCHHSKPPDKLSLKKLKEELHRRHLSAPGTDKAKLAETLKEVMSQEHICGSEECECFLGGFPCHADVCGCCAGNRVRGSLDCKNPRGNFLYKEDSVQGYRHRVIVEAGGGRPRSSSI